MSSNILANNLSLTMLSAPSKN